MTLLYIVLVAALVALTFWAIDRARRIRAASQAREDQVLAAMAAVRHEGVDAQAFDLDSVFERPGTAKAATRRTPAGAPSPLRAAELSVPGRVTVAPAARPVAPTRPDVRSAAAGAAESPQSQPQSRIAEIGHFRRMPADNRPSPPTTTSATTRRETSAALPPDAFTSSAKPRDPSPLRDLVLTWFEARGYRPVPALPGERPIEFVLRHKADPLRAYAFALIPEPLTRERASALLQIAKAAQAPRLLLACEHSVDEQLASTLAHDGIRTLDQAGIDTELASTDAEAAKRIRALAERRGQRPAAPTDGPAPLTT